MNHDRTLSIRRDVRSVDEGDRLLSTTEAAAYTPYHPRTLANLRSAGRGPAFIKMRTGAVAYRLRDLLAWQDQHRRTTIDQH